MNLENAKQEKQRIGNTLKADNGIEYALLVMPALRSERDYYIHWCNNNLTFNDESLTKDINFSSNNDYVIAGVDLSNLPVKSHVLIYPESLK
jgi:hypothetical protein